KNVEQRLQELQSDSRVSEIQPNQVLCGVCKQWIKLQYSHVKVKDESSPEERREELERDGRCERIEPHRVFCKLCMRQVGLHVKKDYSLSNWYRHVKSCSNKAMK
ncbi:hypothetical protein DFH11DRAFT_1481049, partial [Phellopilus nigrolimitatus]